MFVPKIEITDIPVTADSMVVTDITGNTTDPVPDTTGYIHASAWYPQVNTEWHKFLTAQLLGTTGDLYNYDPSTDKDGTSTATVTGLTLTDGIWMITEYWMRTLADINLASPNYTIDATRKILTRTGGTVWVDTGGDAGLFEGIYAIGLGDNTITTIDDMSVIDSLTATTITLKTALNPLVSNSGNLNLFYRVQKYILVMNTGEGSLMSDIGDMAISELNGQGCDDGKACSLARRIVMKTAAQIAFVCGNYTKAHNLAILFNKSTSNVSSTNCTSC